LKEELQRKPTIGKSEQAFYIKKEGIAQILLLGLPNTGKSTLFSKMTNAFSEVADYPFTTQKLIPGMMKFENLQIQLVDTPPIQLEHVEPGFSNLLRNADALLLVVDLTEDPIFQMEILLEVLKEMRIRVGGRGAAPSLEIGWAYLKAILLGNKCDFKNAMETYRAFEGQFKETFLIMPISAKEGMNIEELKREVYQILGIIRVYTKAPGGDPDLSEPVVLKRGSTVEDVALSIHKDFLKKLRYARIWGSGKFDGQMVKRDYPLSEGDVIELHI
jgi:ribosome-interacting GTPase 1